MDIWHQIVEVWEYCVDHGALLVGWLFGFDPKPFVPWAQFVAALLAMTLSSWGLLNLWNHFDFRRRALLAAFLTSEEKKILEAKRNLAMRFQRKTKGSEGAEPLDIHARLNSALGFFDGGKIVRAERELSELQGLLKERREIARKQSDLAIKQTGAVHLFLGSIAASQEDVHRAVGEFKKAIECNDKDLDAWKYLIEQRLVLSEKEPTSRTSHLDLAVNEAEQMTARIEPEQIEYLADAYRLKGTAYLQKGNNGNARDSLKMAGNYAEQISNQALMAEIFEKLGKAQQKMGKHLEAKQAFGKSVSCYENIGGSEDAARVRLLLNQNPQPSSQMQ